MIKFRKQYFILTFGLLVLSFVVIPVMLRIPPIKEIVVFFLSFTDNTDYQVAYVELWGVIFGSFLAIYGALWVENKTKEREIRATIAKYACVVYYDMYFVCREFVNAFKDVNVNNDDECCKAIKKKQHYYINENWIVDVAQLHTVLSAEELESIYCYYEYITNINKAIKAESEDAIKASYKDDICRLLSDDGKRRNEKIDDILEHLLQLMNTDDKKYDDLPKK